MCLWLLLCQKAIVELQCRLNDIVDVQVLRYNTGSAIRPKNSRQDQFWDIIHGQKGDGEAQEALPRKKGVQLCGTQPPKILALSDFV